MLPAPEPVCPAPPLPRPETSAKPLAHPLHTIVLLGLLLLSTVYTSHHAANLIHQTAKQFRYLSSIALEVVLLGLTVAGIRQRRAFFRTTLRNPSTTWPQSLGAGVAVYFISYAVALALALAIYLTPWGRHALPGLAPSPTHPGGTPTPGAGTSTDVILAMLPHTPVQFLLWFGVSLSAGVCEELVFRGYLLQQFTAWFRRPILAVLLVAAIFGSVHLYEGAVRILPLAGIAVLYGLVTLRLRGDLRTVIVAHTLLDFLVAVLNLLRLWLEHHRGLPPL